MTVGYPIAARRKLDPTDKAHWYSKRQRKESELLKPDAHHVLVYRVGGQYVLDNDRMPAADDRVVSATHVSLVDMRRDAPVIVGLNIPSADASSFEVMVTFVCTVNDAIAVVRGGIDAREALWSHLKAHHKLFELGLQYNLSDVNEVRRVVGAQITAYMTIRPPIVPGMTMSMASVEVSSPEILTKYAAQHRDKDFEQRLARQEQEYQQQIKFGQVHHDQSLESVQQEHDHRLADRAHGREQMVRLSDARQNRTLTAEQNEFENEQFEQRMELIGSDPRKALMAAFVAGRIDASTLAEQLRVLDDHDRQEQIRQLEFERDERRELTASEREESRREREDERRREDQERADWLRVDERDHQNEQRREQNKREDERELLRMRVELLRQSIAQGHMNMADLHAEKLYAEVMGLSPQPEVGGSTTARLAEAQAPVAELEADEDKVGQVREEDD